MKVWITKYALTREIFKVEAEVAENFDVMIIYDKGGGYPGYAHGEGREWHLTKDSAVKRAEAMRAAKIASIEKSLQKLKNLKFRV